MALLSRLAAANRSTLYRNSFKDAGVQRIRSVSRPGNGIATQLAYTDGVAFECNLQPIVRRTDDGESGMALTNREEYTLKYPMDVSLGDTDRVEVNGVEFEVRRLYNAPDGNLCRQAWLMSLP